MKSIYSTLTLGLIMFSFSGIIAQKNSSTDSNELEVKHNRLKQETNRLRASLISNTKNKSLIKIYEKTEYFNNGVPFINKTDNKFASTIVGVNKVKSGGSLGYNLNGDGQMIYQWDGSSVLSEHIEFDNRISNEEDKEIESHATHVAGTIIARGLNIEAEGVANKAQLKAFKFDDDINEILSMANQGMILSNHSYSALRGWEKAEDFPGFVWIWYGDTTVSEEEDYLFGFYDYKARFVDEVIYTNPKYVLVTSAGNVRGNFPDDGPPHDWPDHLVWQRNAEPIESKQLRNKDSSKGGFDTLSDLAVAKNTITVGSAKRISNNLYSVSDFSSYGPTDDGRVKPDIIAPGENIFSTFNESENSYHELSGTSMSTPIVTGSISLIQEFYKKNYGIDPDASLVKALIIHTADQLADVDGPMFESGWGVLNTANAISLIDRDLKGGRNKNIRSITLTNNSISKFTVIPSSTEKVKVTICWTDPQGPQLSAQLNPTTSVLVNDLDIRAVQNDHIFLPFSKSQSSLISPAIRGDNSKDNVEQILVDTQSTEPIEITIAHKGSLRNGVQDFNLIITGFEEADVIPPTRPAIISPTDGTNVTTPNPELTWNTSENTNFYEVQLSSNSDFESLIWSEKNLAKNSVELPVKLESNGRYYWRVRSVNEHLKSDWSSTGYFDSVDFSDLFIWDKVSTANVNGYVDDLVEDIYGITHVFFSNWAQDGSNVRFRSYYTFNKRFKSWRFVSSNGQDLFNSLWQSPDGTIYGSNVGRELMNLGKNLRKREVIYPYILQDQTAEVALDLQFGSSSKLFLLLTRIRYGEQSAQSLGTKIKYSNDKGNSWSTISEPPFIKANRLFVDKDEFIVTSWGNGTWRSTDAGNSWERINDFSYAYTCIKTEKGTYVLGTLQGIYFAKDDGFNWVRPTNGQVEESKAVKIIDRGNGLIVANSYACGGTGDGVYYSFDSGESWITINNGFETEDHRSSRTLEVGINGDLIVGTGTGDLRDGGAVYTSSIDESFNFVLDNNLYQKPSNVQLGTNQQISQAVGQPINLSWTPSEDAFNYLIEISRTDSFIEVNEAEASSSIVRIESFVPEVTINLNDLGETYYYRVRAQNALGNSEWSSINSIYLPIDYDNDGVLDDLDLCNNSSQGAVVNVDGCEVFSLSNNNFSVRAIGESCESSKNGRVIITAENESYNYQATLRNGDVGLEEKNFNDFTEFQNLSPGNYNICLTVQGQDEYQQCFDLFIPEAEPLKVESTYDSHYSRITLDLDGAEVYYINLNGVNYQTTENQITLDLNKIENNISVTTDKKCQGAFTKRLVLIDDILAYPNPLGNEDLNVYVGELDSNSFMISFYDMRGTQLFKDKYSSVAGTVQLNLSKYPSGMYLLNVSTEQLLKTFKIQIR